MTSARLLVAALLLCALPVSAQDQQSQSSRASSPPCLAGCNVSGPVASGKLFFFFDLNRLTAVTPSEPWRTFANPPATRGSASSALEQIRLGQYDFGQLNDLKELRRVFAQDALHCPPGQIKLAAGSHLCIYALLGHGPLFDPCKTAPAKAPETWGVFPSPPADLGYGQNPLDQMQAGQYDFSQITGFNKGEDYSALYPFNLRLRRAGALIRPEGQLADDTTCLTMRSYVVARDSKDSDSTHLVSYSTCQPGARYRVKTTEMRSVSPDRRAAARNNSLPD